MAPLVRWQFDADVSSFTWLALDHDLPAVLLNDFLRVWHSQTEAATLRRTERLKNLFDLIGTHA
jgi:hypothetical protein